MTVVITIIGLCLFIGVLFAIIKAKDDKIKKLKNDIEIYKSTQRLNKELSNIEERGKHEKNNPNFNAFNNNN